MIEWQASIPTGAGDMGTFICHPERGGPHPVLFFLMDAPGIREELRDMARRLAAVGYFVCLPNLYHHFGLDELGPAVAEVGSDARRNMMALVDRLTIPMVMVDVDALIAFTDSQPAASKGDLGCLGYCMSGQFAVNAAVRYPGRVKAVASVYGTRLVTDSPDSPHRVARQSEAEFYFACAELDEHAPVEMVAPLRTALAEAHVKAEVELYTGVGHGFAFSRRPAYDRAAGERHWERLFSLFGRTLHPTLGAYEPLAQPAA